VPLIDCLPEVAQFESNALRKSLIMVCLADARVAPQRKPDEGLERQATLHLVKRLLKQSWGRAEIRALLVEMERIEREPNSSTKSTVRVPY
jgi:hypothetical protein